VSGVLLRVVMPAATASDGRLDVACATRFCTCTDAVSGSRSRPNVTESRYVPADDDVDSM